MTLARKSMTPTSMLVIRPEYWSRKKNAQLVHHSRDGAVGIAIGAVEGRTRMGIGQPQAEPPGRDRRCPSAVGNRAQQPGRPQQETPSVHSRILDRMSA